MVILWRHWPPTIRVRKLDNQADLLKLSDIFPGQAWEFR